MSIDYILPVSMILGIIGYSIIFSEYIIPRLNQLDPSKALAFLTIPHIFRYIGLVFLIEGVTAYPLDSRFAHPAAYGDLLAAVLALIAVFALLRNWKSAIFVVWIFNIEGFLDLINAVARGLLFTNDGHLGAAYFIPALIVPFLLVSHFWIFKYLMQYKRQMCEYIKPNLSEK